MGVMDKHSDTLGTRILIKKMDKCIEITYLNRVCGGQHIMFLPGIGISNVTELNRLTPEYKRLKCRFEEGEGKCDLFAITTTPSVVVSRNYETDSYSCDVVSIHNLDAYLGEHVIDDSLLGPLRTLPWYYDLLVCRSKPNISTYGSIVYNVSIATELVIPLMHETGRVQTYDQSLLFEGFTATNMEHIEDRIVQTFELNEFTPCANEDDAIHLLTVMNKGRQLQSDIFDIVVKRMLTNVASVSPAPELQYVATTKLGRDHMIKFNIKSVINKCLVV